MKNSVRSLAATLSILLTFCSLSCTSQKGPVGKIGDKIDDALDTRPAEGLQDAVEKITKK